MGLPIMLLAAALATQIAPGASQPAPAATPAPVAVTIPFNPPLDRRIRYEKVERRTENGRETAVTSTFSLAFARHEGGYRMTVRDPADDAVRSSADQPVTIVLISREGRISAIENRDAILAHFRARQEAWAEPMPATERDRTMRIFMTLLAEALNGDSAAGPYAPALAMAGATLPLGREVAWPMIFYEEFRPFYPPWRVTLERVEEGHATVSAEASVDRTQATARYEALARRFEQGAGEPIPAEMGWRSPASAEHYLEQARATYRVSLRDGLLDRLEMEEIRERRDPGDAAMTRQVETRTLRRLD